MSAPANRRNRVEIQIMAKVETIKGIDKTLAEKLCAGYSAKFGQYPNLSVADDGTIQMYSGNAKERANCREIIERSARKYAAAKTAQEPAEKPATAKQAAYLVSLIERDPAAAMALNVSADMVPSLSMAKASRLIDQLSCF